jgi:serine/threonine protein kinase/Tol biopolymer transport system component
MSDHLQRLKLLLAEALALPEAERKAFVDGTCAGDAELRAELERLIQAHDSAGDFLEKSVVPPETDLRIETCGSFIGRYKLLQEIGEGGFGRVFMAEQTEPVHRKVALKIVKAGMDTREVIARFEAERQALALMDHPNIARVLDAGATKAGRPYFVMELVKGIPITDYCDRERLSTGQRLQLFMQVCHAVQHAHQKGIIHRDLKPTNILVTVIDGEPVPKIIDFGVAKALGQKLTEKTLFTRFEEFLGTPAYMSPEQAELSGVDVDTRSDIYSLGVLLYELLTGVTPFDAETFRKVALDEVRRIIREVEPPKPSTRLQALVAAGARRLKTSGDGQLTEEEARASSRRQLLIKETVRLVHGDLDWIVMKCLEKDRTRRYEAPEALLEDIQRHVRHEPVKARPPSTAYRLQRFARRHRGALAATTAVLVILVAALVFNMNQARRGAERVRQAEAKGGSGTTVHGIRSPSGEWLLRGIASVQADMKADTALSPDETMLAYVPSDGPDGDLLVRDLATGAIRNLTQSEQHAPGIYECCPSVFVWSPDSQRIAYLWAGGPDLEFSLRLVTAHGQEMKVLKPETPGVKFYPEDWTANGKQVLCELTRKGEPNLLVLVAADTGEIRELMTYTGSGPQHPRLSPDNRYVVFAQREAGDPKTAKRNIHLLDLQTGKTTQLTFWPGDESSPIWAPQAPVVLFSSDRLGNWDLWGIRVQNGQPDLSPFAVQNEVGDYSKRLTQSGTLLLNRRVAGNAGYTIAGGVPGATNTAAKPPALPGVIYFKVYGQLHSMRPDGSHKTRLPASVHGEPSLVLHGGHRWFLDVREVAGEPYPSGAKRQEVFAVRDDGDETVAVQLTDNPDLEPGTCLRWTRDPVSGAADDAFSWCARLWDRSTTNGVPGIYMARVMFDDAGNVRPPAMRSGPPLVAGGVEHDWSPDGRRIVFNNRGEIQVFERDTGRTTALTAGFQPAWSPDGSRVAFHEHLKAIHTIRLDGSDLRTLITRTNYPGVMTSGPDYTRPLWSPDGGQILYCRSQLAVEEPDLWLVPANGGEPVNLTLDVDAAVPVAWREGER